jgi:hypothetical protein
MVVQPESAGPIAPPEIALAISFTETIHVTAPNESPFGTSGEGVSSRTTGRSKGRLLDYSKVSRSIRIDTSGNLYAEGRYLEGNSDLRIPRDLYERIKGRMHPADMNRKPIVRYTIANQTYSGYAEDGSLVSQRTFSRDAGIGGGEMGEWARTFERPTVSTARVIPFAQRLTVSGVVFEPIGSRDIIYEEKPTSSQVGRIRKRVDAVTGVPSQALEYDGNGKLKRAVKYEYKPVRGIQLKTTEISNVFQTQGANQGRLSYTRQMHRTDVTVYIRGRSNKSPEPMTSEGDGK